MDEVRENPMGHYCRWRMVFVGVCSQRKDLVFDSALIACKQAPTQDQTELPLVRACLLDIVFGYDLIACKQAPRQDQIALSLWELACKRLALDQIEAIASRAGSYTRSCGL
jgi:hypothetical protein